MEYLNSASHAYLQPPGLQQPPAAGYAAAPDAHAGHAGHAAPTTSAVYTAPSHLTLQQPAQLQFEFFRPDPSCAPPPPEGMPDADLPEANPVATMSMLRNMLRFNTTNAMRHHSDYYVDQVARVA